jgi:3-oxoacyl-[acyl-carrier-protein] synthase II
MMIRFAVRLDNMPLLQFIGKPMRNPFDVRVVITGMGTINPIGSSVSEFWENLIKGKSGVRHIASFPINGFSVQIAGEVDLPDLKPYFKNRKMTRRLDRFSVLAQIHTGLGAGHRQGASSVWRHHRHR